MKHPAPRISEAEWEVMEILWQDSPRSAQAVVTALLGSQTWKAETIRTMLGRLVKKGALTYQPEGKRYLYRPAVRREDCVQSVSRSFLSRIFGDTVQPLLVQLVKESRLSRAEIEELKQILKQKQKGK